LICAHTGPEGLKKALEGGYQAVILDCMLPGMDGFELLRQLRLVSNVPVLMLTALGDESDRIAGLELGGCAASGFSAPSVFTYSCHAAGRL
jgi:DNA-binding response OmpR family regulator